MDNSDPVVVEGMQNMQIHQSGRHKYFCSLLKLFENKSYLIVIGAMPKLCYVSGIDTQFDNTLKDGVSTTGHTFELIN